VGKRVVEQALQQKEALLVHLAMGGVISSLTSISKSYGALQAHGQLEPAPESWSWSWSRRVSGSSSNKETVIVINAAIVHLAMHWLIGERERERERERDENKRLIKGITAGSPEGLLKSRCPNRRVRLHLL